MACASNRASAAKPAPRPVAAPADTLVQVGAYAARPTAEAVRRRLATLLQQPVRTVEDAQSGRSLYKVQVGPLTSEAAREATTTLQKAGFGQYQLIKK